MKKCNFCKCTIAGKFWKYSNGSIFCDTCYQTSKKCKSCSIPTKKGIKQENNFYCSSCAQKAKRCNYCHKHIFSKSWQIESVIICNVCYQHYPRCARCNTPSKDYLKIKNKNLCLSCTNSTEYCAKCHIPLLAKFFHFSNDTRKFCSLCVKSKDCCDICTTPITTKYFQIGDQRKICSTCMKTAIQKPADAQKILTKVIAFLEKKFSMKINSATKLELVDALTLSKIRKKSSSFYGSKDRRALGLFVQHGNSYHVYIESLLPYALCLGVMSHEYTHAWQADNFTKKASLLILEGLAEWISYKTLIYYGYKNQANLITHQKDIYGQGFQKIITIEKKYGIQNVLTTVKNMVNKG